MEKTVSAPSQTEKKGLTRLQIASVALGNGLEFYDFLTYSFFAAQIGRIMFPQSGGHGLLLSLATFGAGFLTRPLGAIVFGRLADRRGRKPAMLLSFLLMGVGLVGLAATPGYAAIGIAAPILVVLFRLIQGFAIGGELGPNTAFLFESAPVNKRGLFVSFQNMTQDAAVLVAGLVGVVLSSTLSVNQLDNWGWRIAFLIGAAIVPFALLMRRTLAETLPDSGDRPPSTTAKERRAFGVVIGAGLVMLGATAIAVYSISYIQTYGQAVLGLPPQVAFLSIMAYGVTAAITDPIYGLLVDRFGRKRVITVPWIFTAIYIVPCFLIITRFPTPTVFIANTVVLTMMVSGLQTGATVLLTEALPTHIRAGALGIIYALGTAVFGGSAQFIEHGLVELTHINVAPSYYIFGTLVAGFLAMLLIPEQSRAALGRAIKGSRPA